MSYGHFKMSILSSTTHGLSLQPFTRTKPMAHVSLPLRYIKYNSNTANATKKVNKLYLQWCTIMFEKSCY